MGGAASDGYRFEGFELDLTQRRLTAPDGRVVSLPGRAHDVLVFLIENRGRVVGKDELMRAVWPTTVVEENNLNQAISALRRAFRDSRDTPRFIVTVAGRGYQFVADVHGRSARQAADSAANLPADPASLIEARTTPDTHDGTAQFQPFDQSRLHSGIGRRRLVGALGIAVVVGGAAWWVLRRSGRTTPRPRSIAVLPFRPLVEQARNEAIEFGITETLINRLSELQGLVVLPLSSVRRYESADADPIAAGRELGADAVLDGHVQVQRNQVRLTARMIDVASGTSLWSGRFDEQLGDFFLLQDALAKQLVDALAIPLTGAARRRLVRRDTGDVEAWRLYLNGQYHWDRRTEPDLRRAIEFFEAAMSRDPDFALAAAGLANAWAFMGIFNVEPARAALARAKAAAERAVALDDTLAETIAALGHVRIQYDLDFDEGRRLYDRALALKPNFAMGFTWRGLLLTMRGEFGDALRELEWARSLEPASLAFASLVGFAHFFARDLDRAYQQLSQIVATAPEAAMPRGFLAFVQTVRGEPAAALSLVSGLDGRFPGGFAVVGHASALMGDIDTARSEIARLQELGAQGWGVGYDLAVIQAGLGDFGEAVRSLARAIDDRSQMVCYMNVDPRLDSIRDDAGFRQVSRRLGLT